MPDATVQRFISAIEQRRLDDALQMVSETCHYDNVPLTAGLFIVSNGLITLWRDYFDRSTFEAQMAAAT